MLQAQHGTKAVIKSQKDKKGTFPNYLFFTNLSLKKLTAFWRTSWRTLSPGYDAISNEITRSRSQLINNTSTHT
jgi:hypothetical protein